jgi:hypothetical protein
MSSLSSTSEAQEPAPSAEEEEISPEQIIGRYKEMRAEIKKLAIKADDLDTEFNEHQ